MAGQVQEEILQIGGAHLHAGQRYPQTQQPWQQGRHVRATQFHLIAVGQQRITQAGEGRVIREAYQHAVEVPRQQGRASQMMSDVRDAWYCFDHRSTCLRTKPPVLP